jgi:hypothetical protein
MKAPPFPLSSRPKRSAAERSEVLLRTQGDENASVQQPLPTNRRPLLVIPSEGEGSAVLSVVALFIWSLTYVIPIVFGEGPSGKRYFP